MMKIFHTFCASPLPRARVLMCDNGIISTERWPKRKKVRGVCTINKPINKLIDGFIYFYDTTSPSTSPSYP